jgi:hypothetical protein
MAHASPEYGSAQAELVYALNTSNRIVHVSEVERGGACDCRCPACGSPLVARKGDLNIDHFGHVSNGSCAGSGPQTALHYLAKEITTDKRQLYIPEVRATHGLNSRTLHKAQLVVFDDVKEEYSLVILKSSRPLLVEFVVTHRCDGEKIAKLLDKGIAALEIDLSRLARNAPRHEIEEAVIRTAPRKCCFIRKSSLPFLG